MASLQLTCQQMSQAQRQRDEETLYIVGVELDLNHFSRGLFNNEARIFNRLYIDQSFAVWNSVVPVTK
eukprot:3685201-Alexandrium_andersonii.AAC.1